MKVALFHTDTILSSWTNWAMARTIERLGHEVIDARIPCNQFGQIILRMEERQFEEFRQSLPTLDQLKDCDLILVLAAEYIHGWIEKLYGFESFNALPGKRAVLFVESAKRGDVTIDFPFHIAQFRGASFFYPDRDDAKEFGGYYVQPCVDTEMFKKADIAKRFDVAFAGTLYPRRFAFLKQFEALDVPITAGPVMVIAPDGPQPVIWTKLYVKSINEMKIHFCLPSNNERMMVARPLETMACGTFCLTYDTPDNPFSELDCKTYDPHYPEKIADVLKYYLKNDNEREQIAAAGMETVRAKFSTERIIGGMLEAAVA